MSACPFHSARRADLNLLSTVATYAISVLANFLFTPWLVRRLGPGAYALVPLMGMWTAVLGVVSASLNNAAAPRAVAALMAGRPKDAAAVLSTTLGAVLAAGAFSLVAALAGSGIVLDLLRVREDLRVDAERLLLWVAAGACLSLVSSAFEIVPYVKNALVARGAIVCAGVAARVGSTVALMCIFTPAASLAGAGLAVGSAAMLATAMLSARVVAPELRLRISQAKTGEVPELVRTAGWLAVTQLGTVLFLYFDLLAVNLTLGAESATDYALAGQWAALIRGLASSASVAAGPAVTAFLAAGDYDGLRTQLLLQMERFGILLALPVGLVAGFAGPLLNIWMGCGWDRLAPLLSWMVLPLSAGLATMPLYTIPTAAGRVRVVALVSVGTAVVELGCSWLLLSAGAGLCGAAAASVLALLMKNIVFLPPYAGRIARCGAPAIWRATAKVTVGALLVFTMCRVVLLILPVQGLLALILACAAVLAMYTALVWLAGVQPAGFALGRTSEEAR